MLNDGCKITPQELMNKVKHDSGKRGGWPNYFKYDIDGEHIMISAKTEDLDKKAYRRLDPWGLAFLVEAESGGMKISSINFAISGKINQIKSDKRLVPDLEAFRRRISFLSINNQDIGFGITINGEILGLDGADTLFNRPDNEKIHGSFVSEAKDNTPGRLEKDFQTWLFASDDKIKKEDRDAHSNVRLAVLGDDFFNLKKKGLGIIRECHTGAFQDKISNNNRILPTEFVDIVSLNKRGQLAVIELKLNDSQLEVIAQLLDYSLFFRCYQRQLWPIIAEKLQNTPKSKDIICYVVNNHFHVRFNNVLRYYSPKERSYGFRIKKVLLGYYLETCQ